MIKTESLIGEVLGGLILSPLFLNIVSPNDFLEVFSAFSVIMLMFLAGILTNFNLFYRFKRQSFIIASFGVVLSIILVLVLIIPFGFDYITILVTAILLSNSAIEVCSKILSEKSPGEKIHSIIVGASFFDDILAIFIVGIIVSALKISDSLKVLISIITAVTFLIVSIKYIPLIFEKSDKLKKMILIKRKRRALLTFTIVFSLTLALIAKLLGLSVVIGAYVAGLVTGKWCSKVGPTLKRRIAYENLIRDIQPLVTCIFSPLFFGYVGVLLGGTIAEVGFSLEVLIISIVLIISAVLGKLVGCWLGARLTGLDEKSALLVGSTMIGRGALEMVLVEITYKLGIISSEIFIGIIITTLASVIIAPIFYSYFYEKREMTSY